MTDELTAALKPLRVGVALLPINGRDAERESRGIVGNMDAAEAAELALDLGASRLVPYHWDGFVETRSRRARSSTPQRECSTSPYRHVLRRSSSRVPRFERRPSRRAIRRMSAAVSAMSVCAAASAPSSSPAAMLSMIALCRGAPSGVTAAASS